MPKHIRNRKIGASRELDAALGTDADARVAAAFNVSAKLLADRRRQLGIAAFGTRRRDAERAPSEAQA